MTNSPADLEIEVRQLKDRVRLLEAMARHSRDLLFTIDLEGRITGMNDAAEQALGWCERDLIGRPFGELTDPANSHEDLQPSTFLATKRGDRLAVEIRRERHIIIAHDLAQRRDVEESLRQSQKMETLGILA